MIGPRDEYKKFHVRDGSGIKYLMRSGVDVVFVTGRQSEAVERRASELGVSEVHQKVLRKWEVVEDIIKRRGVELSEVAYMGDDLIDLPVMIRVGLSVAPFDAAEEVRHQALAVTRSSAGQGSAREFAEACLRAKGKWQKIVAGYLDRSEDPR